MITRRLTHYFCLGLLIALTTLPAYAGQVYRFIDKSGVKTISTILPPYAAQQGYEIIDISSLRVIEKVSPALSKAEIAEYNRQSKLEQEQQRMAVIQAQQRKEGRRQATLYDANLRASYRTEDELIKKREATRLYFQNQITKTKLNLKRNKQRLYQYQQQAADIELSGKMVTGNLKKSLIATEQEINNNQIDLARLVDSDKTNTQQYDRDLIRLRELLLIDAEIKH